MSYTVNLGCWGSIFAVPTDVVDKYLKISGSAQLKVLLYILRHSGEQFDIETIAQYLNMGTFDVKDCIEFWSSFNIIAVNNNVITPAQGQAQNVIPMNNTQNFFTQPTVQSNVQMPISYPSTTSAPYSAPIPTPAAMPTSSPPYICTGSRTLFRPYTCTGSRTLFCTHFPTCTGICAGTCCTA